jgi:sulfhydrogenase subunit beta (sulfur reductase)
MPDAPLHPGDAVTLDLSALDDLLEALKRRGRTILGPVLRDGAVVLGEVTAAADLARDVADEQEAGRYRLRPSGDATFGYAHGPDSFKRALHPPDLCLLRVRRDGRSFSDAGAGGEPVPLALFGVRACDLAAIRSQDRIFLGGPFADTAYAARRQGAFIVALACTRAGGTCFCASTGTGPRPDGSFDVRLTELPDAAPRRLLAEAGTARGAAVLAETPHGPASGADHAAAEYAVEKAAASQRRTLDLEELPALLFRSYEHPLWDDVARRCLACGNCTLVCPTCFCTTVEDRADLDGGAAERTRRWDSCFAPGFSYIHGGSVRPSIRARYRQWLMHKLATWTEQFGTSGCVGCGRCITWCPAGIDLTEEVRELRRTARAKEERRGGDA